MSNLFDILCRLVEAETERVGILREFLEPAAIFQFDQIAAARKSADVQALRNDRYPFGEAFFLPFGTTAILSPFSLVILQDTKDEAVGLNCRRNFMIVGTAESGAVQPLAGNDSSAKVTALVESILTGKASAAPETPTATNPEPIGLFTGSIESIELGDFDSSHGSTRVHAGIIPRHCCMFDSELGGLRTFALQSRTEVPDCLWSTLFDAFIGIAIVNTPARFVVQESTEGIEKQRKKILAKKHPRLIRTDLRPKYTLLRPNEIRKLRGDRNDPTPGATHSSPCPHLRRRHMRTFHSQYFRNRQGQSITIEAKWIGPSEFQTAGKLYKVLLDI